ncbi:thiamine phosphate synthase [Neobacillus cucumis]|uniref:thiamine phosphate synthase n=1 Tax=Neobacillus cucumis TaxID=1740721 RepID=UPI0025708C01|nr:thiamine phosphate synthase [Neobacillus cucumis]
MSKEFHLISNGQMPIEQFAEIVTDIQPYITAIHLREKIKTARELFDAVEFLTKKNIPLSKIILNDRVDVASVTGVAGVQLAYHSLDAGIVKDNFQQLRVGSSIHSFEDGLKAIRDHADYVLFGHVYPSHSKPGKIPKGLEELKKVSQLNIPVIAIGGIRPENTYQVLQAGATGIAVISGVLDAKDPVAAVKSYANELKNGDESIVSFI